MTSGDGADVAPPPEMPATSSAVDAAAEAAALCYDSDDLLTQRRGVLPVDRSRPENGHTEVAEPVPPVEPEPAVDLAIPNETTLTADSAPSAEQAPPHGAVAVLAPPHEGAEQPAAVGPAESANPAIAAGPEHGNETGDEPTPDAPVPTAEQTATDAASASVDPAPSASVTHETSSPTVEVPDHPGVAAGVVAPEPEAVHAAPTPSVAATTEILPEEPAAPPVPTNGVALHAAQTTEFLPVEHDHTDEPADLPLSSPDSAAPPAGEIIELPLPLAGDAEPPAPTMAANAVVDDIAGGVDTPAGVLTPAAVPEPTFASAPDVLTAPDIPAIPPGEPPAPPQSAAPPPPPAAPPPEEGEEEGATMTIIEHLEELRHRITISAISVVVGAVIAWFIVPHVVHYLETAFQKLGGKFFSQTILGPFGLELKLSFLIGLIIASPVVLFQIWGFVAPGLTRREKRYALPFSLIGSVLFAAGAVTGILIVPLAIQFLTHFFTVLDLEQLVDIDRYIMFIALIAVIFGITFELPIFMVGFSLLGIVNSRFFIQKFRIAIFVIFGVSMVITPGADLISPLVLGGFLTVLYWLGVLLIRIIGR